MRCFQILAASTVGFVIASHSEPDLHSIKRANYGNVRPHSAGMRSTGHYVNASSDSSTGNIKLFVGDSGCYSVLQSASVNALRDYTYRRSNWKSIDNDIKAIQKDRSGWTIECRHDEMGSLFAYAVIELPSVPTGSNKDQICFHLWGIYTQALVECNNPFPDIY